MRRSLVQLAVVLASCAAPAPAPLTIITQAPVASSSATTADATHNPSALPTTTAQAPLTTPAQNEDWKRGPHQVDLVLRRRDAPCTLMFEGIDFAEDDSSFDIWMVSRMATLPGGSCSGNVFFDVAIEPKPTPGDVESSTLVAGAFTKAGHALPAGAMPPQNPILDMNFDGYADLCVAKSGVQDRFYGNYVQRCWLFDPLRRTFVREQALDPLIYLKIDSANRKLISTRAVGVDHTATSEYQWVQGTLTMTAEELHWPVLPDGQPLPPGVAYWKKRKELRGGRMNPVFDGPVRGRR